MTAMVKRQLILRANKYERQIIDKIALSFLLIVAILALCVFYLYYDLADRIIQPLVEISAFRIMIILILTVIPLLLLTILFWLYKITNHLLGAFERILRELDAIIAGEGKRHLKVRQGDQLAAELVARINTLIDRLP